MQLEPSWYGFWVNMVTVLVMKGEMKKYSGPVVLLDTKMVG